jgi:hypothetical protein
MTDAFRMSLYSAKFWIHNHSSSPHSQVDGTFDHMKQTLIYENHLAPWTSGCPLHLKPSSKVIVPLWCAWEVVATLENCPSQSPQPLILEQAHYEKNANSGHLLRAKQLRSLWRAY